MLTQLAKAETVGIWLGHDVGSWVWVGAMMRVTLALFGAALVGTVLLSAAAQAQPASSGVQLQRESSSDVSAQRRLRRVPIYPREEGHWQPDVAPRYNPGPNAVRVCNASYAKEFRPSGTVIVPHTSCYWRR